MTRTLVRGSGQDSSLINNCPDFEGERGYVWVPEINLPGNEAGHSTPLSVQVKNAWRYASTLTPSWDVEGNLYFACVMLHVWG